MYNSIIGNSLKEIDWYSLVSSICLQKNWLGMSMDYPNFPKSISYGLKFLHKSSERTHEKDHNTVSTLVSSGCQK